MSKTIITYQIDLKKYRAIRTKKYTRFSKSDLASNMLWGNVTIVRKNCTAFFHFEAALIRFFIDFYNTIRELSPLTTGKREMFGGFDTYYFELKKSAKTEISIILDKNKKQRIVFDSKPLLAEIGRNKVQLLSDFKVLFEDFKSIKEVDYILSRLSHL